MPSTVIRSYRYDPAGRELHVEFVSGRRYRYHEVPEETYAAMRRSFSKGRFFNRYIREHFRCTLVDAFGGSRDLGDAKQSV